LLGQRAKQCRRNGVLPLRISLLCTLERRGALTEGQLGEE
jgi:hypothetical protein